MVSHCTPGGAGDVRCVQSAPLGLSCNLGRASVRSGFEHTKELSLPGSQEDGNVQKTVRGQKERGILSVILRIQLCPRGEMNDTSLTKLWCPQRHTDILSLSLNMSVDTEMCCRVLVSTEVPRLLWNTLNYHKVDKLQSEIKFPPNTNKTKQETVMNINYDKRE